MDLVLQHASLSFSVTDGVSCHLVLSDAWSHPLSSMSLAPDKLIFSHSSCKSLGISLICDFAVGVSEHLGCLLFLLHICTVSIFWEAEEWFTSVWNSIATTVQSFSSHDVASSTPPTQPEPHRELSLHASAVPQETRKWSPIPCQGIGIRDTSLIVPTPSAAREAGWLAEPSLSFCIPSLTISLPSLT